MVFSWLACAGGRHLGRIIQYGFMVLFCVRGFGLLIAGAAFQWPLFYTHMGQEITINQG